MLNYLTEKFKLNYRNLVTLVIFSATFIILFMSVLIWSYWEKDAIENNSRATATSIVKMLAQDIVRIHLLHSTDAAADMSAKLEAFNQLRFVEVYNTQGEFLFSYRHSKEKQSIKQLQLKHRNKQGKLDNYQLFKIPVNYRGKHYGEAIVYYSTAAEQRLISEFYFYLYWTLPLLLIISFVLALILQKHIARPIQLMADVVEKSSNSDEFAQRMDETAAGELGVLACGFNHLMKTIQQTQAQLYADNERLRVTLESIAEGVIVTNTDGFIEYMNPVAEKLMQFNEEDAIGRHLEAVFCLVHEKTDKKLTGQVAECVLANKPIYNVDNVCLKIGKKKIAVQNSIAPIRDLEGKINGTVVVFRNVSQARDLAKKLQHQASHDGLTDLINRNEFEIQLNALLQSLKQGQTHALIYLDLDQFKIVNDTCGHIAGDSMLRLLSGIIRNQVRDSDIVARLGGDEFGILLPRCSLEQAKEIAEKVLQIISEFSFKWEDKLFRVGASIGVVAIADRRLSYFELLKQADIACYAAKNLGRNRIHVYEPGDKELAKMHGEMQWVSRLETALEANQFHLFIQKVVPTHDAKSASRYEVLIRFIEADGTINFPGAFLGAAERYGLMTRVDQWVIENTLKSKHALQLIRKVPGVLFNVNVSHTTLDSPNSTELIYDLVKNSKFPATNLCFEFTETAASINVPSTLAFIRKLKKLGCKFALDDFGSGLSSFGYLKYLPVDYIKIDGTLVKDIPSDKSNLAIVESVVHIGKVMGIETIAEYVHSKEVYDALHDINVDFLQGYFIHRPMPIEELEIPAKKQTLKAI